MIDSLTSFRFITALVVFLFHCKIHLHMESIKFIGNGAVFMTGFFVLSGFIMVHVYQRWDFTERKNIFNFYLKRFAKIYPAYALATVVFFTFSHEQTYTGAEWLRIVVNDLFLVQGFFPSMFDLGLNGGTWSLTVEGFLYLMFPFLLIMSAKSPRILWAAVLVGVIVTLNVNFNRTDYYYATPVFRLADFMTGMGFYFLKDKPIFKAGWFHILLLVLLFLATSYLGSKQFMTAHLLVIMLFGAWVACVYHSKSVVYNNRVLVYLGLISYSFYLWQFWAIQFGKYLIESHNTPAMLAAVAAFAVNIVLSVLSYHLVEERARVYIVQKYKLK